MTNFDNSKFNIRFIGTGAERILSCMDSEESKVFLEHVARITYEGKFVCAAYWCTAHDTLDISHENEESLHFQSVIVGLMKD